MKEILKKLSFLLCFVALLSLVAGPLSADPTTKSDHPWDDASSNAGNTVIGSNPNDGDSEDQAMTAYNFYLGFDGLFKFLADSFAYYYQMTISGSGKDGKTLEPEFKSVTSSQSKG